MAGITIFEHAFFLVLLLVLVLCLWD